jgi:NADPH:quinone reductase-like Zn-dependent oxidoreductase
MRAYEIHFDEKGEGRLVLDAARPSPRPAAGEVLIRVRAASLNYRDLLVRAGRYGRGVASGVVPLSDGAGEVAAVGPGVSGVAPGDRVVVTFFRDWLAGPVEERLILAARGGSIDGMLAEEVVVPAANLLPIPPHLSFAEAATLPCAALTAWHAVVGLGAVTPGRRVLLIGTGGVSIFALQFARLMGAETVLVSGHADKLARARALGADHGIDRSVTPAFEEEVRRLFPEGVDLVVEVGGAGTLERSLKSVRVGGTIAVIGVLSGPGQIDPRAVLTRSVRLQGIYVGSRAMFAEMNQAITHSGLKPVIDQVFPFEAAEEAYQRLASGTHFGKIVITIP